MKILEIKSTIAEMKNSLAWLKSILELSEELVDLRLIDRDYAIRRTERKQMKENEWNHREKWSTIKCTDRHIVREPGEERKKQKKCLKR